MAQRGPDSSPEVPKSTLPREEKPLGLLAWIAGYKVAKAALATLGGVVIFRLGDRNLVAIAHRCLVRLGFDPEGWVGTRILPRLGTFNAHSLHTAGLLLFVYAILYCVEAVGLFMEKRWAEWFTVVQTSLLIPVEIHELLRRPGPIKIVALTFSVSVVIYLLWRIRRDDLDEAVDGAVK